MTNLAETVKSANRLVRHAIGAAMSSIRAGDEKLALQSPGVGAREALQIHSDAFDRGHPIPRTHAAEEGGGNISPALHWSGVPERTQSLALIIEDPDAPMTMPFVHWMIWNIPPKTEGLPPAVATEDRPNPPAGAVQGKNDAKKVGFHGPLPPRGHGVHHYHFQLFALDMMLSLTSDASREDLVKAMAGHVLAEGELVGTYERN